MRHGNSGRKFDRNTRATAARDVCGNLTANLVLHERIETTDAKAKELRRVAERLITKAMRLGEVAYTEQEKLSADDKARRLQRAPTAISAYIPRFVVKTRRRAEEADALVDIVEKIFLDLAKRFKGARGRIHADREVRAASRRQRADIAHRVRGRVARERRSRSRRRRPRARRPRRRRLLRRCAGCEGRVTG